MHEVEEIVKKKYNATFDVNPDEVIDLFNNPEITKLTLSDIDALLFGKLDLDKILNFMCIEHGFDEQRIEKYAKKAIEIKGSARQRGIGSWM